MAKTVKPGEATTVEAYLAALPANIRTTLEQVRKTIKAAAPGAEELISYKIPAFKLNGMLVSFAAMPKHCSFFVMSSTLLKNFSKELKGYETSTGTIRFSHDKPLPATLIKKIVSARIKENQAIQDVKALKKATTKKASTAKKTVTKLSDEEIVDDYMQKLEHPLKAEIEAVRKIIKGSNKKISERIKWNGPSYYYKEDLVTFNPRNMKQVHLVFHHPHIVKIGSNILKGDYKDRRMVYFADMKEIKAQKKELEKIINDLVNAIE